MDKGAGDRSPSRLLFVGFEIQDPLHRKRSSRNFVVQGNFKPAFPRWLNFVTSQHGMSQLPLARIIGFILTHILPFSRGLELTPAFVDSRALDVGRLRRGDIQRTPTLSPLLMVSLAIRDRRPSTSVAFLQSRLFNILELRHARRGAVSNPKSGSNPSGQCETLALDLHDPLTRTKSRVASTRETHI